MERSGSGSFRSLLSGPGDPCTGYQRQLHPRGTADSAACGQSVPQIRVLFKTIIRVTRNADINLNEKDIEEDEDYRQYMKKILKKRSRLSAIRLELYKGASPEVLSYLCSHLRISPEQVFVSRVPWNSSICSRSSPAPPPAAPHLCSISPLCRSPLRSWTQTGRSFHRSPPGM